MKTKLSVNIVLAIILAAFGSSCQKKDALSTKLDELNKEYQSEQVISKKEHDLKVATIKAGKELPTPIVVNPAPQKVQVEVLPLKGEAPVTKVEIVKPIPAQAVPAQAPVAVKAPAPAAPAASTPVAVKAPAPVKVTPVLIATPVAPVPAAPETQTAKVETKVTTKAPAAPAAPKPTTNLADTLGKGGIAK
jgi:outer membrane murein-binding lipoprotein Lpp